MRIATYLQAGEQRLGALDGDDAVVDLNRAAAARARAAGTPAATAQAHADATVPADVLALLTLGEPALADARAALDHARALDPATAAAQLLRAPLADVGLLPPVPNPPKIICVGRNYAEHAREAGRELSPIPIIFPRFAATLLPDGGALVRPTVSEQFDWEGELAIVIGRRGRHISKEAALDHVAGYSVFNDATIRDFQFRTTQYTAGKNFHASGPFGPALVTRDEVADPHALRITTHIDGELQQDGNTRDMLFDIPTIVAHLSEFVELEPGDVIPTGTPAGVGFKRTPPRFLQPGEVVRVEVEGVGVLTNPVVAEEAR